MGLNLISRTIRVPPLNLSGSESWWRTISPWAAGRRSQCVFMFQSWCTDVVMVITKYKAGFRVGLVKPPILSNGCCQCINMICHWNSYCFGNSIWLSTSVSKKLILDLILFPRNQYCFLISPIIYHLSSIDCTVYHFLLSYFFAMYYQLLNYFRLVFDNSICLSVSIIQNPTHVVIPFVTPLDESCH